MPTGARAPEIAVWSDDAEEADAGKLAARLGIPLIVAEEPPLDDYRWLLFYDDGALHLHDTTHEEILPLSADYLRGDFSRRWRAASGNDLLLKAIGLKKGVRSVCDATAGLGYDAFFLAVAGDLDVTACERHPVATELAMDAFLRVKEEGRFEELPLFFYFGDATDFLERRPQEFDAVYLDPMYPKSGKETALPKKEMFLFRELVGDDPDAEQLFHAAWKAARKRVVVKRADDAAPITASRQPDIQFEGKTVRYDVYLKGVKDE